MAFPFTFNRNIKIIDSKESKSKGNIIIASLAQEFAVQKARNVEYDDETLKFVTRNSFLGIEYEVKVKLNNILNNYSIDYTIGLDKLIKITLLIIIFAAFFSFLSLSGFLVFILFFTFAFYSFNVFFINSYVEKTIVKVCGLPAYNFEGSEYLTNEQQEWIKNPKKCPACGAEISDLDLDCPECGLLIRKNRFSVPLDISKYSEKNIKYHYKEK